MKRCFRLPLTAVFLLYFFCCCSQDDIKESPEFSVASMQVTIVFAPGQVGDQGYADHIMKCIPGISTETEGEVDVQYLAFNSDCETLEALRLWSTHQENPYTDGYYQKRLLILTEANQSGWLDSIQTYSTDDILMLNTSPAIIDSLSKTKYGERIHALNISVANEIRQICDKVSQKATETNKWVRIDMMRKYDGNTTADSVDIVLAEYADTNFMITPNSFDIFHKDLLTGEDNYTQSLNLAYYLANIYYEYIDLTPKCSRYPFIDAGICNIAFKNFIHTQKPSLGIPAVFWDTDTNHYEGCYTIQRHYDRAILQWIKEWYLHSKESTGNICPHIIWHGSWDGFVETLLLTEGTDNQKNIKRNEH